MGVEKIAEREEKEAAEMGWDSLTGAAEFRMKTTVGLRHLVDQRVAADLHQVTLVENSMPKKRKNQDKTEHKPAEFTSYYDKTVWMN